MADKRFTLAEANALLPAIRTELSRLQSIKKEFEETYAQLRELREQVYAGAAAGVEDPLFQVECQLEFLHIQAKTHLDAFDRFGVQLKDIEGGLVDFPAVIGEESVFLCWKLGEDQIRYYHGVHEGYQGRRPLDVRDP